MPDRMPNRMPEDMPDRMPEDMPDRMSEDLPVTKRINAMVGITQSKAIYFSIYWEEYPQLTNIFQRGRYTTNQFVLLTVT